jgi:C-terminal processing protease CtpA/Prc
MDDYSDDFNNEIEALNEALDKVMNDIKASGVSKLILDIRFNGGGFDKISLDIASRFLDHERFVFSKKERLRNGFTSDQFVSIGPKGDFQYTGDIILLTSPITASAAEVFALCMKDLPYVTILGENTNGVFSDILTHVLPNDAAVGLSNEVYSDVKGVVFEVVGIGPATEGNRIPFLSTKDFENNMDSGIEKAITLLKN